MNRTLVSLAPTDDRSWAHLDRLKLGRYGEYYAKMALGASRL